MLNHIFHLIIVGAIGLVNLVPFVPHFNPFIYNIPEPTPVIREAKHSLTPSPASKIIGTQNSEKTGSTKSSSKKQEIYITPSATPIPTVTYLPTTVPPPTSQPANTSPSSFDWKAYLDAQKAIEDTKARAAAQQEADRQKQAAEIDAINQQACNILMAKRDAELTPLQSQRSQLEQQISQLRDQINCLRTNCDNSGGGGYTSAAGVDAAINSNLLPKIEYLTYKEQTIDTQIQQINSKYQCIYISSYK